MVVFQILLGRIELEKVSDEAEKLLQVAENALYKGIDAGDSW